VKLAYWPALSPRSGLF